MSTPKDSQRGAAAVELALLAPFLLLLILGTVEIGWLFAQQIDVRHGAREGARLISVDADPAAGLVTDLCNRMDLSPGTSVLLERDADAVGAPARATVSLTAGQNTLTGFLDWAIPSSLVLSSTVETRLQVEPNWSDPTSGSCP